MAHHTSRRTSLTIAGIVVMVCTAGFGGLAVFSWISNDADAARDVTEAFVEDLEAGEHTAAHDRLCRDTRDRFSQEAFESHLDEQRLIRNYEVVDADVSRVDGIRTSLVTVELEYDDGTTGRHVFQLVEEDGTWRICGDPY